MTYSRRRALQELGLTALGALFFWPALFFIISVATNSAPAPWEWLGAILSPLLLAIPIAAVIHMKIVDHHLVLRSAQDF
jgi:hypothetical protein